MLRRLHPFLAFSALLALGVPARLLASPTDVYVLSEGRILKVNFGNPVKPTQAVNGDIRHRLQGIVVLDDGLDGIHLVVGENPEDKVWVYDSEPLGSVIGQEITSISGLVELPEGINAGANGDVYLVNQLERAPDPTREVWRIKRDCPGCAGGYGTPVLVDGSIPSTNLEDTVVVDFDAPIGPLVPGDLLVLSRKPSQVLRYPGGAGPRQVFIGAGGTGFPVPTRPTAMAFAPDGNLLVATAEGKVLRFDGNGNRVLPDFISPIGDGATVLKMRVGIQDGENRAFITDRDAGEVRRYRIELDGTGTFIDKVSKIKRPLGVGIRTSRAAPSIQGEDRLIVPVKGVQIKFEDIEKTGLTDARVYIFPDPAPASERSLSDVPGLLPATGLPDRTIPAYLRAFVFDDGEGPHGTPSFFLVVVDSTAGFGKTQELAFTPNDYGFETECSDGDDNPAPRQPRTFHATDADDPEVVEGVVFKDISSGCGTNQGRDSRDSGFLTGWDARSLATIVDFKLDMLRSALNGTDPGAGGLAGYISEDLRGTLNDLLDQTVLDYGNENFAAAVSDLDDFIAAVLGNLEDIDDSQRNVSGELQARAVSATFLACGAVAPDCNQLLP